MSNISIRRKRQVFFLKLILPAVVVVSITFIYPLIYNFWLSFTEMHLWEDTSRWVGINNYVSVFRSERFYRAICNNFLYVGIVIGVNLVLGMALALYASIQFRGVKVLRLIITLPMLFIPAASATMWSLLYNEHFGLINILLSSLGFEKKAWLAMPGVAIYAVMFTDIWSWTPFVFLVFLAGLQNIPIEYFEVAQIDGASKFQCFRYVTLPLMRSIIVIVTLFRCADVFRAFDYVWVMTRGGPGFSSHLLSTYTYLIGFSNVRFGMAACLSMISLAISSIMVFVLVKALRSY